MGAMTMRLSSVSGPLVNGVKSALVILVLLHRSVRSRCKSMDFATLVRFSILLISVDIASAVTGESRGERMSVLVTFDACGEAIGPQPVTRDRVKSFTPRASSSAAHEASQNVTVVVHASRLEVRFIRHTVSPVALTGLFVWLHQQPPRPIVVIGMRDRDVVEVLPDRKSALAFLSDLIALRSSQARFERRETDLELSRFGAIWRAAKEICTADIAEHARWRILDKLFAGTFTLAEFDDHDGSCRMAGVGSMMHDLDPQFAATGQGVTYCNMADRDYGAWISETFKSYRDRDRPFAERIGAAVSYAAFPSKLQFTRLVVPFRSGGRQRVLVASDVAAQHKALALN